MVAVLLASVRMQAGSIEPVPVDVSATGAQWLNPTDKLLFTVAASNYSQQAARWGLSSYPNRISFQFLSIPEPGPGEFTAWWQTPGGELLAAFPGTLSWSSGRIQSSAYTGPVSVLYGSLQLSAATAAALIGNSAVLVLENEGGPVRVGLPPYTLGEDLFVGVSAGGFGTSAVVARVQYLDPPPPVPEPPSGAMLALAGIMLCCASRVMNRISHRHIP